MGLKPGYKQTEVGMIPEDWEVERIGSVASYTNGEAHERHISDYGKYVVVNSKFISTEGEIKKYSDRRFCPASAGDVLMVMSDVPNGRAIAKCFLVDKDESYTVNQRICVLRPRKIDGKFLFYKLDRNPFYLAFDDGAKQTNLRKSDVLSCPIVIPKSDEEQRAIAEALSDVDALIGALDRLIAKKRDLKQAAMQQLLTGQKRLLGFTGVWKVGRLGDFAQLYQPETIGQSKFTDDGYPVYGANGIIGRYGRYNHSTPQITISCRGNCGTVNRTELYSWITGNAMVVNLDGNRSVDRDFMFYLLKSQDFSILVTGSGQPQIVRGPLADFKIKLPQERAEQTAIAEVLLDMDSEIVAFERRRDKTRALKQGMMQELLSGRVRLVNPASVKNTAC